MFSIHHIHASTHLFFYKVGPQNTLPSTAICGFSVAHKSRSEPNIELKRLVSVKKDHDFWGLRDTHMTWEIYMEDHLFKNYQHTKHIAPQSTNKNNP